MEDYKNYIMPGIALLLMLAWFFVIKPMMGADDEQAGTPAPVAEQASQPAAP